MNDRNQNLIIIVNFINFKYYHPISFKAKETIVI